MHLVRHARLAFAGLAGLLAAACGGGGGGNNNHGGTGSTAQDLASVTPSALSASKNTGPGEFAADILRSTNFTKLIVEIDYAAGHPPSVQALNLLQDRLEERCDKPAGVEIDLDEAIPAAEFKPVMSLSDVEALEDAHRDTFSDFAAGEVAIYCLYTTGASDEDTPGSVIVGYAYRGGSIVVYVDNAEGSGPLVTDQEVEGYTLVHEFGHMMGLVNNGCPMVSPHEDTTHPSHDTDSDSVMYWQVNISPLGPSIGEPGFAQFGPACVDDVQSFGGL
jgi:hypothetical protein